MKTALLTFVYFAFALISFGQFQSSDNLKSYEKTNSLRDIELYDIDGDGLEELISINSNQLILYTNLGAFNFQSDTIYSFGANEALDLQMIDINNAGAPEFIVSIEGGNPQVFSIQGNSLSHDGDLSIGTSGVLSGRITSGLIDGNSHPDFIISNGSAISVYVNLQNGTFSESQSISIVSHSEALGDVTGDGLDDLCIAQQEELSFYKNQNESFSQSIPLFTGFSYTVDASWGYEFGGDVLDFPALRLEDVNTDGNLDILYGLKDYLGTYVYNDNQEDENGNVGLNAILVSDPGTFPESGSGADINLLEKFYSVDLKEGYAFSNFPQGGKYDIGEIVSGGSLDAVWSFHGYLLFKSGQNEIEVSNIGALQGQPIICDLDNSGEADVLILSQEGTTGIFKNITSWTNYDSPLDHFASITDEAFRPMLIPTSNADSGDTEDVLILEQSDLSNRLIKIDISESPVISEQVLLTWPRYEESIVDATYEDVNADGTKDLIFLSQNRYDVDYKNFNVSAAYYEGDQLSQPVSVTGIKRTNNDKIPFLRIGKLNGDAFPDLAIGFCKSRLFSEIDCETTIFLGSQTDGFSLFQTLNLEEELSALAILEFTSVEPATLLINTLPGTTTAYSQPTPQGELLNLTFPYTDIVTGDYDSDGTADLYTLSRQESETVARISVSDENNDYLDPIAFDGLDEYARFAKIGGSSALDLIDLNQFTINIGTAFEQTFNWEGPSGEVIEFKAGSYSDPSVGDLLSIEEEDENFQINYWRNINSNPSPITVQVFEDLNGDGEVDAGEEGIAGIPIQFSNTDQEQEGLAFTNNEGEITFEVISSDSLTLTVNYNEEVWVLTTANSPLTLSAANPPEVIEFGLQSIDGLVELDENEQEFEKKSFNESKDASSLNFEELNGITSNNFIFIEEDYAYRWTYENNTGETLSQLEFENSLPAELNWLTFSPAGSSHNANTVITSTQGVATLEVSYNDLILADAAANPEESQLLYDYLIKAETDLPHGINVSNQVLAYADGQDILQSNQTSNKIYTCERFEEFTELAVVDYCSLGSYGFTVVENEPMADYELWDEGTLQAFENLETLAVDADTTFLGIMKNSGIFSAVLTAENEFGCLFNQTSEFEIDSIPQIEVVSDVDLDLCVPLFTEITAVSDIPATLAWNTPVGVMQNPSIQIGIPGNYSAFAADIHPTCVELEILDIAILPDETGEIELTSNSESLQFNGSFCEIQWYLDGEEIEGATSGILQDPEAAGLYTCRVSSCECFYFTEPLFWSPLDVVSYTAEEMELYPSPATDMINLSLSGAPHVSRIAIIDMLGKEFTVRQTNRSTELIEIDLNGFAQGVYLMSIRFETGERLTKKFVVEK